MEFDKDICRLSNDFVADELGDKAATDEKLPPDLSRSCRDVRLLKSV